MSKTRASQSQINSPFCSSSRIIMDYTTPLLQYHSLEIETKRDVQNPNKVIKSQVSERSKESQLENILFMPLKSSMATFLSMDDMILLMKTNKKMKYQLRLFYEKGLPSFALEKMKFPSFDIAKENLPKLSMNLVSKGKETEFSFKCLGFLRQELGIENIIHAPLERLHNIYIKNIINREERNNFLQKMSVNLNAKCNCEGCITQTGCCLLASGIGATLCTCGALGCWGGVSCIACSCSAGKSASMVMCCDGWLGPMGKLVVTITSSLGGLSGALKYVYEKPPRISLESEVPEKHIEEVAKFTRKVIMQRYIEKGIKIEDEARKKLEESKKNVNEVKKPEEASSYFFTPSFSKR